MDLHQAEVTLYQEKVEKAHLRASIHGVVVTPKVEEKIGKLLKVGDAFCELVDQDHLAVEMNVPETDISLIRTGAPVALKLNAFPTLTIRGTVERVSPQTVSAEGEQFFVTRALFPNPDVKARDGMAGQAKITSAGGWVPQRVVSGGLRAAARPHGMGMAEGLGVATVAAASAPAPPRGMGLAGTEECPGSRGTTAMRLKQ
jgi:hypothetical protein